MDIILYGPDHSCLGSVPTTSGVPVCVIAFSGSASNGFYYCFLTYLSVYFFTVILSARYLPSPALNPPTPLQVEALNTCLLTVWFTALPSLTLHRKTST